MKTYLVTWEIRTTQGNVTEWTWWHGKTAADVLEAIKSVRDWKTSCGLKRMLNIKVRRAKQSF